jgi:hypothetical protein
MIGVGLCGIVRRAAHGPTGVTAMGIVEKTQARAPVADFGRFSIAPFRRRAARRARNPARASDALRQKDLDRDGEGRYFIKFE